ncbi:MAG: hypothetical protein PVH41_10530 [Anaerolineae bacterium]|jgi:hypothetical protein
MRRYLVGPVLVIFALLSSGCSGFVDPDQAQFDDDNSTLLEPNHPVGQTFVARHGGLRGLEVWLAPDEGHSGEVRLHLRREPGAEVDIATATLALGQVTEAGTYLFSFPPLRNSHGRYYYAFLELTGDRAVKVGQRPGNAYLDGALYRNHEPLDAQMAFRLTYSRAMAARDLAGAAVEGAGLLAVAGLLYVVPGWALVTWLWPTRLSWAEKLGIAAGVGLAVYPLLMLWTHIVGLNLGPVYAWVPLLGGTAAMLWRYRRCQARAIRESVTQWGRSAAFWPDLTLVVVVGLVFAVRLFPLRALDAPMWGDSYQHTMISQLLADNRGLFESWEPYVPLKSFTYHFGFHSTMAALHWLTGMAMHKAVLGGAQLLNGLAVLALYPLGLRVSGNRWGGVGAVLVAGLLSPVPMVYVNWGRYTQLAGQVILPAAVLISWHVLQKPGYNWRLIALNWITVGGLALTHYRVLIFFMGFVLAWTALSIGRKVWRQTLTQILVVGVGAGLLFLPWFVHVLGSRMVRGFRDQLTTAPSQVSSFMQQYNAMGDLTSYMGPGLWLLLAVAVSVGLWRRKREVLLVAVWWLLLFIATNPELFLLPGTGAISNFALFIALYIPAAVLIGYAGGELVNELRTALPGPVVACVVAVGIGLAGVFVRARDVDPVTYSMVTRPDLQAMAWIRENTPADARFLVNSFTAYGGSVVVGSDGGWWLPLLGDRANTVPPLNYGTERGPRPGYREWVNEVTARIQEMGVDDLATLALLRERGVTHVYIGQRQGRVNYSGPHVLDPETMRLSKAFRQLYHRDRVWVFSIHH